MSERIKPILGGYAAFLVIAYISVNYFFDPQAGTEILPAPWSLVAGGLGFIIFFDTIVQKTGNAMLTAMTIAISQILMVDFYYVLNGTRDAQSAFVSMITLLLAWGITATVYDKLS